MTIDLHIYVAWWAIAVTSWSIAGFLVALGMLSLSDRTIQPEALRYISVVAFGPVLWAFLLWAAWSEANWSKLWFGKVFVYRWPGAALRDDVRGLRIGSRRTGVVFGFSVPPRPMSGTRG